MKTNLLLTRRARVCRLTQLAQKDRNICKVFQGYRLISLIDKRLAGLSDTKNIFKY